MTICKFCKVDKVRTSTRYIKVYDINGDYVCREPVDVCTKCINEFEKTGIKIHKKEI